MADLERSAEAVWRGDLRNGKGEFSATSGVFKSAPYSYATRFEQAPGTNPEEMLAAAHAACFSMAFANTLSKQGHKVNSIETRGVCHLTPQPSGGFKITKMELITRGKVEGVDETGFKQAAEDAKKNCPVSGALSSLEIVVTPTLVK